MYNINMFCMRLHLWTIAKNFTFTSKSRGSKYIVDPPVQNLRVRTPVPQVDGPMRPAYTFG